MSGLKDAPRLYRTLRRVLPPTLGPYLPMRAEGLENIPLTDPVIIASNHLSFIDSLVLPINLDRPIYFIGKADYWDSWKTRWFFKGTGVIPVERSGKSAGDAALDTGCKILGRGEILGIYPEGTRSPDGRLYRGKTGPARLALKAGVNIIPSAVIGTDKALPTGAKLPVRHPVTVRYGKPLDFSRYAGQEDDPFALRSATDELMYEIMMLSGQEYVDEYASKVKSGQVRVDDVEDDVVDTSAEALDPSDEAGSTRGRRAG